mmetsp:Transcript_9134/g.16719  ORF Transcript_9134/g.16719 Transcript_9134/m.16719 type:complete len:243 (-) Transcript_9134:627-1355(-)
MVLVFALVVALVGPVALDRESVLQPEDCVFEQVQLLRVLRVVRLFVDSLGLRLHLAGGVAHLAKRARSDIPKSAHITRPLRRRLFGFRSSRLPRVLRVLALLDMNQHAVVRPRIEALHVLPNRGEELDVLDEVVGPQQQLRQHAFVSACQQRLLRQAHRPDFHIIAERGLFENVLYKFRRIHLVHAGTEHAGKAPVRQLVDDQARHHLEDLHFDQGGHQFVLVTWAPEDVSDGQQAVERRRH